MSDSLCDGMNESLNNEFNKFKNNSRLVNSQVNKVKDKLDIVDDTDLTDIETIQSSINDSKNQTTNRMNDIKNASNTLTGSCLTGIFNQLNKTANNIGSFIDDMLSADYPETGALGSLDALNSLLDKLGIGGVINKLDELLGCLSDSDCLPVGDIQGYYDQMNSFLDGAGLTDTGEFNQDTFMDKLSISDKVKNGLDTFKTDMGDLKNEIKETTESTMETVKQAKQPDVEVNNQLF